MNQQQYLERHYDRLALRLSINDRLAKRERFADLPIPAIGIYQGTWGHELLMPGVRSLVEARQGWRCLELRLLILEDRKRDDAEVEPEIGNTEQMELFAC